MPKVRKFFNVFLITCHELFYYVNIAAHRTVYLPAKSVQYSRKKYRRHKTEAAGTEAGIRGSLGCGSIRNTI